MSNREHFNRVSTQWMQIAGGTILTIGGPVLGAAQSSQTKTDTYTWNGEFVSLDTTAKTMTVKLRDTRDVLGSVMTLWPKDARRHLDAQ